MTSRRRWTAICYGLAAWFWCTAGAYAQERSASQQPEEAGRPAVAQLPSDIPWHTFEQIEPRYKIEAMRFKCRDETGIDWPGSDEVMIGTDDAKGDTVSDEFGDIDSGNTRTFDPAKSCIVPVRPGRVVLGKSSVCEEVGEPAPLSFRVEFWEKDFSFGSCVRLDPGPGFHAGRHCLNWGADDFIGRARIDLSPQELEAALPNVGAEFVETGVLNPCRGDESVCDVTFGPDYSFTYRVTRLADVRTNLRSLLDEAMQRSGARSELEVIAAGLRSLRAPSPRKIEPERKE